MKKKIFKITLFIVAGILMVSSVFTSKFFTSTSFVTSNTLYSSSNDSSTPKVKISGLNTRKVDFEDNVYRAYPDSSNNVKFKLELLYDGDLTSNVVVSVRTFDVTALVQSDDYAYIDTNYTFYAHTTEKSYTISVETAPTDFGIYHTPDDEDNYLNYNDINGEYFLYGDNKTYYSDTGYNSRYFGIEIYNVEGATIYREADSKGNNVLYDTAYGTLPVSHYLPYTKYNDTYMLTYYTSKATVELDDVAMSRDEVTTGQYYINSTTLGKYFGKDVINTGIGHYYFNATMKQDGSDGSQRDSYAGITYQNYLSYSDYNGYDTMKDRGLGVVTYELDGYPDGEVVNFGAYRRSDINSDDDDMEWSEASYQHEKYRTDTNDHDDEDSGSRQCVYAYKINGNPEWVGVCGEREKFGEKRKLKDIELNLYQRDDSPVTVDSIYVEDLSHVSKTQNDSLRVYVRFNEPVQISGDELPQLICGFNSKTVTSPDKGVAFNYECGSGTDTLVFKYELKGLPTTDSIQNLHACFITNGTSIKDFSSLDSIYVTDLKANNENYDLDGTKKNRQWNLTDSLGANCDLGYVELKLNKVIDPRDPEISSVTSAGATISATTHAVTVTLAQANMDVTLYAHWTDDLNGSSTTVIPRPTTYLEEEIIRAKNTTNNVFNIESSRDGMVYLWLKAVTGFGKVDERVVGPFYFDNSADTIEDICLIDGDNKVINNFTTPTKTKYVRFTINHTTDYTTCSGQDLTASDGTDIMGISQLDMLWSTSSVWGSNTIINSTKAIFQAGKANSRDLILVSSPTVSDYVYEFKMTDDVSTVTDNITRETFMTKSSVDSSYVKKEYVTSRTYKLLIGYDESTDNVRDFGIGTDNSVKLYLGFLAYDGAGNVKKIGDNFNLQKGSDYCDISYLYFDTRNIVIPTVDCDGWGDKEVDVLVYASANENPIDGDLSAFLPNKSIKTTLTFDLEDAIEKSLLDSKNYSINIVIKKPNTTLTTANLTSDSSITDDSNVQSIDDETKEYTGYKYYDYQTTHDTPWLTWKLTGLESSTRGDVFRTIEMQTKTTETEDICGYYELWFVITNTTTGVEEVKFTQSISFYLGTGHNDTSNIDSIDDGKLLVNKVFKLGDDTKYYYKDDTAVVSKSYSSSGSLVFSNYETAREYLRYLEQQDFYLWKIPNDTVANNLNGGQNPQLQRSKADKDNGVMAQKDQYWIRYKSYDWSMGSTDGSKWVYYYYSSMSDVTEIDTTAYPKSLTDALSAVLDTILETGETVILTSDGGLDDNGSPYVNKDRLRVEPESTITTIQGSRFKSLIYYGGDAKIYSASIYEEEDGELYEYKIASTATLTFSKYTNIYISPVYGSWSGFYGKVSSGSNVVIRDIIDDVYRQIAKTVHADDGLYDENTDYKAPSGEYMLLEIDENGINYTFIYIDRDAPQLNFEYTIWATDADGELEEVTSSHYYTNGDDIDHTIRAVSFTITGIGSNGAHDGVGLDEIDTCSYIAVWDSSRTTLLYAMDVSDLIEKPLTLTEDGTYHIEVYDRSGNNYEIPLTLVTSEMEVILSQENDVVIKVKGRSSDQIREFEVKLDNVVIDQKFSESKTYTQSGFYSIKIVDWYGYTYEKSFTFQRVIPDIEWRLSTSSGYEAISDESLNAKIVKESSILYRVVTSMPLSFRYKNPGEIAFRFIGTDRIDDFTKVESTYTSYTQNELFEFTIEFYYVKYPKISVTYNVVVDTQPPVVEVSYDTYSFRHNEEKDLQNYLQELIDNNISFNDGDVVVPRRMDYLLSSVQRIKITSGSLINTSVAYLKLVDSSGISSFKVQLDDKIIYEGEYRTDGNYPEYKGTVDKDGNPLNYVNYNEMTGYGTYTITVYDLLNNKSTFTFTNTSQYDVDYYVDGENIVPEYDYVYKVNANGQIEVDENEQPIVLSKWLFTRKFSNCDAGTTSSSKKGDITSYIEENNYTFVQYGNEGIVVKLLQKADVKFLITLPEENNKQYFIGIKYDEVGIKLFRYIIDIDGDEISIAQDVSSDPILQINEILIGSQYEIYQFEEIGISIMASIEKSGYLSLSLNVPESLDTIACIETKVESIVGTYEPAYYKTYLSLYKSDVDVYNGKKVVNDFDVTESEWVYTNGDKLTIVESSLDPYVTDIYISYSNTMSIGTYSYLYTTDSSVKKKDMYKYGNGDGYYVIKVVNAFKNERLYRFALSNGLLVSTTATYEDGLVKDFESSYEGQIGCNGSVQVTFSTKGTTYTCLKDDSSFVPNYDENTGSITLRFYDKGTYQLIVTDNYGNEVIKNIVIKIKDVSVPEDSITGFNAKALRINEGYTNTKTTISTYFFNSSDIKYVAISHADNLVVLYDDLSTTSEKIEYNESAFTDCVGNDGDGDYVIIFRDSCGNKVTRTVHYRETSTLGLTRLTKSSQVEEQFDLEDALNPEITFISNKELHFYTIASEYEFYIDNKVERCPKTLAFTNNGNTGDISYNVYYLDEYGFEYTFVARLYRTVVNVSPSNGVNVETFEENNVVKKNFTMTYSDTCKCWYNKDEGEYVEYQEGTIIKEDGSYLFYCEDVAGNVAYYTIIKDSIVYFSFTESVAGSEILKGLVTSSTSIVFNTLNNDESYIKYAFLNGELQENGQTGYSYSKNGKWEFVISDKYQNETNFMFYIVSHELNYLDYYVPQDFEFSDIWYTSKATGKISYNSGIQKCDDGRTHFEFKEAGSYSVIINSSITGLAINFMIEISDKKPTTTLEGCVNGESTITSISIKDTVQGDTVVVYRNGSLYNTYEISKDGEEITLSEEGEYSVVVKNLAGNKVTYSFTKNHVANVPGSVLIIIGILAVVIGLIIGLIYRNKSKVDK